MRTDTRFALQEFCDAVALAIAREHNGKDVAWRDVIEKNEKLNAELDKEDE